MEQTNNNPQVALATTVATVATIMDATYNVVKNLGGNGVELVGPDGSVLNPTQLRGIINKTVYTAVNRKVGVTPESDVGGADNV